jgi:hypothetical protein
MSALKSTRSNGLLDHTNDLRGSGSRDGGSDWKRSSDRCNANINGRASLTEMNYAQQENFRPSD